MIIPEHTKVPDTNGSHQRTDHLVELASGRSENSPERRISHVQKRLYGGLNGLGISTLILCLVRSHRCRVSPRSHSYSELTG